MTVNENGENIVDQNKDQGSSTNDQNDDLGNNDQDSEKKPVPYTKFAKTNKLKNDLLKQNNDLQEQVNKFNEEKQKEERKNLASKGKYEEALKTLQDQFDGYKAQVESDRFNDKKDSIFTKYNISEDKQRFITGKTIEEIEESAKLFSEMVKTSEQKQDEDNKKENLEGKPNIKKGDDSQLDWGVFFK